MQNWCPRKLSPCQEISRVELETMFDSVANDCHAMHLCYFNVEAGAEKQALPEESQLSRQTVNNTDCQKLCSPEVA